MPQTSDDLLLATGGQQENKIYKKRAVANNESSEVVGLIKPGRRFQLRGHMQ